MSPTQSPTFPSLHLRRNSFSNPSVALPTSRLILQPFRCFTCVTALLQTFFRFSYVTGSSLRPTLPGEPPKFRTSYRFQCKIVQDQNFLIFYFEHFELITFIDKVNTNQNIREPQFNGIVFHMKK